MISLIYKAADYMRAVARGNDDSSAQGRMGEDLAHRYLRRHGCTVVARNYRPRSGGGEIDLVAWHGGNLAIVEVKARATEAYGSPDRAVDSDKQTYLIRAARDYARRADVPWERIRFDVVSVILTTPPRIEWQRGAFRGSVD